MTCSDRWQEAQSDGETVFIYKKEKTDEKVACKDAGQVCKV